MDSPYEAMMHPQMSLYLQSFQEHNCSANFKTLSSFKVSDRLVVSPKE